MIDPQENKPFDYRLFLAFILMFAVVIIFTTYFQAPSKKPAAPTSTAPAPTETIQPNTTTQSLAAPPEQTAILAESDAAQVVADTIAIETPLFTAQLTTLGADLIDYRLRGYHYIAEHDTKKPIALVPANHESTLRFEFWNDPLKLWQRNFTASADSIVLIHKGDSSVLTFTWLLAGTHPIQKTFVFYADRYSFDVILSVPAGIPAQVEREYTFGWDAGLEPTEFHKKEDVEYLAAVALLGKDIEEVKKLADDERPRRFGGRVAWVGVRSKYFLSAVIPRNVEPEEFIVDRRFGTVSDPTEQFKIPYFSSRFAVRISPGQAINHRYTVFMGPLDYFVIKDYRVGLEQLLQLGWKFLIRPFAIFLLWAFDGVHSVVPNYGVVIILFGFLIKALFHPLTKKSMLSMQRMKELAPKLEKLRERFKEDPQRLNKETMKLYKDAGFNPLSGCLPLVAQMPVFFALYQVLRGSIQFRGAEFVAHITDLSQKDSLYILPVIMTISFFWQQKMSVTDPKQKALVYVMPLIFGFLFAQSPAGLTLYWTVYNIFSIVEQYIIRPSKKDEPVGAA